MSKSHSIPSRIAALAASACVAGTILAGPATASPMPDYAFDTTVPLACKFSPGFVPSSADTLLRFTGVRPTSVQPGGTVQLRDVQVALTVVDQPTTTPEDPNREDTTTGHVSAFILDSSNTTPTGVTAIDEPPAFGPVPFGAGGGFGPVSMPATPGPVTALGAVGTNVDFTVGAFSIRLETYRDGTDALSTIRTIHCIQNGSAPVTSVPIVAAPALSTTSILSITPRTAWAGVGGIHQLKGQHLTGLRSLKVGGQRVRVMVVVNPTTVVFFSPPLPRGSYPVTGIDRDGLPTISSTRATLTYQ